MNIPVIDDLPVATLAFLAGVVGALIALVSGDIDFQQFAAAIALIGGGSGAVGYVRNGSGRGVK